MIMPCFRLQRKHRKNCGCWIGFTPPVNQALTGHSVFLAYFEGINLKRSTCQCGRTPVDVRYIMVECSNLVNFRTKLNLSTEDLSCHLKLVIGGRTRSKVIELLKHVDEHENQLFDNVLSRGTETEENTQVRMKTLTTHGSHSWRSKRPRGSWRNFCKNRCFPPLGESGKSSRAFQSFCEACCICNETLYCHACK